MNHPLPFFRVKTQTFKQHTVTYIFTRIFSDRQIFSSLDFEKANGFLEYVMIL